MQDLLASRIPQGADRLYIIFTAEITPVTAEALIAAVCEAVHKKIQKVYLAISTPGGDVQAGVTLYQVLRALPIELTTHNIDSVASAGNVVFLAGENRYAIPEATFMYHGVSVEAEGPSGEQDLRDQLGLVINDQNRLGGIIAKRSSLQDLAIHSLFLKQSTFDAAWARDNGVINDVAEFQVPHGSPVVSFVFARDAA